MARSHRVLFRVFALAAVVGLMSACPGDYVVPVADGRVTVEREYWRAMTNPEPFADNFESLEKRTGEEFAQVLTVYKAPIRADQKGDLELSPRVWVDVMVVHPPAVTIQVRVAHRAHWVLSRQTFAPRPGLTSEALGPVIEPAQARALLKAYESEVRRTQSVLEALTAH